jgi:hypothetical protein
MNERIKLLAVQAQVGSAEFDNGINYFVSTEETFNKFAELIVRECAEIADTAEPFLSSDLIKQHFGVTE